MSQPYDPNNIYDSPERATAEFGVSEGVRAYENLSHFGALNKDSLVAECAEYAISAALLVDDRPNIDPDVAKYYLLTELKRKNLGFW